MTMDKSEEAQATDLKENSIPIRGREGLEKEIVRSVLRSKLAKRRHLVLSKAIDPNYLDSLFPKLLELFQPQTVHYNGGVAAIKEWKISCYLEVMDGGVPTTHPNIALLHLFSPLLETCNDLFSHWYRQQHACNDTTTTLSNVRRLMTFITRYTPAPDEQALLKVCLMNIYVWSGTVFLITSYSTSTAREKLMGALWSHCLWIDGPAQTTPLKAEA